MDPITLKYRVYDAIRAYNAANHVNYTAETLMFADGYMGMSIYRLGRRLFMHVAIDGDQVGVDVLDRDQMPDFRPLLDQIAAATEGRITA